MSVRRTATSLLIALLAAAVSAASPGKPPIKLGISAAFSGPTQSLGIEMRRGLSASLTAANQAGGIHGRRIELISLDDGYNPDDARRNMERLIEHEDVLAVLGNVGTPTAEVTVPMANAAGTLLFGAFTGADLLRREPPDRYVINYRASYAQETAAMVEGLLAIGVRPFEIAFFTQRDGYGNAGYRGAVAALEASGYRNTDRLAHGRYERNTVNIDQALMEIVAAEIEPRAVILVGAYRPCAEFIKRARRALPHALFLNVSFVGSVALADELGEDGNGVIVTQVVPHFASDTPFVASYREDLRTFDPGASPGFVSLEGYIVGRVFVEALKRAAGAGLDREGIVRAVEDLGELDLGGGLELSFSAVDHQGSDRVWPTILLEGRFLPLEWSSLADGNWRPTHR